MAALHVCKGIVRCGRYLAACGLPAGDWRTAADYYACLQSADAPRRGDLDGRGNLSAAGLLDWIRYFLEVCEDQVNYMTRMLALDQVKQRIEAFVTFRAAHDKASIRK